MSSDHTSPSSTDRVSWNQLIAYGMGGLIPIALFNIAGQLVQLLGNIQLGIHPIVLGFILFIPRLWDAFSDPIIGHVSDNFVTRWGRRRPFIFAGGVAVAVSFVGMWWVPRGEWIETALGTFAYNWFQFIFILTGLLIFYTSCNLFEIPHGALGMEMSSDYHERTRLFSSKSFFGNAFALGTPWLIWLSSLSFFRGASGDLVEGMRYVSLLIAALLIPMSYWWFRVLREPVSVSVEQRPKTQFWNDMAIAGSNRHFLYLVVAVFTLATGFNFVGSFANYITIFYLYGGNLIGATNLLAVVGTAWAVTGLLAVFPLNWISRRIGKKWTLMLAIAVMCFAQLCKIVCYNPALPYLVFIPTVLLSTGMLMFFTLGSSMVGDVCDEDELNTGVRREGTYYSVFWWFVKLGTAFAILISGYLLYKTGFDEQQHIRVESFYRNLEALDKAAEQWMEEDATEHDSSGGVLKWISSLFGFDKVKTPIDDRADTIDRNLKEIDEKSSLALKYFEEKEATSGGTEHGRSLMEHTGKFRALLAEMPEKKGEVASSPAALKAEVSRLSESARHLMMQDPRTVFLLIFFEIGVPLLLCIVSIIFAWKYPLSEERCQEIKRELEARRGKIAIS